MAVIRLYDGATYVNVEVTEELASAYAEMERYERLNERRETRRHQSYEKSLEHGFDFADDNADVWLQVERHYDKEKLYSAVDKLTDRQRSVLFAYVLEDKPFRVIGEELGLGTYTVRDYHYNTIKKLHKILK